MSVLKKIPLILIFFVFRSYAVLDVLDSATGAKLGFPSKFGISFLSIGSKPGKKLVYKGVVNFDKVIESAEPNSETTRVNFSGNNLNIEALVFEDKIKIKFADKTEKEIKIVMSETQFRLFNDQCKKFLINTFVQPTDKKNKLPPFSMGVSCDKYEDKIILVVSLPGEAEGGESSLVEGGGKGESWKFYELPSTARDDGMIGVIKFVVKTMELNLSLQNIRLNKKKDEDKKDLISSDKNFFQEMSFGFGSKNLSFQAGTVSSASSGIALDAYLLTKPVLSRFQLAGAYSTALVSTNADNITFSDFSGFLSYSFQLGRSRVLPFGYVKLVDFLHKSTQTRLQATLAGVGVDYRWEIGKSQVAINLEYGAFAPKTISSQIRYQLGYQYLFFEKSKIAMGLFYDSQTFKALNSAGESRTFLEGNVLIKAILISK